jgi:ArsR family transcriptional regulator
MSGGPGSETVEEQDGGTDAGREQGCYPVVSHDLTEHDVDMDTQAFSALGNETRYEVLRLLDAADDELCACELDPELGVNQSTTSRALKSLYQAGLVDRRKDGRWRYYTTTPLAEELLAAIDTSRSPE